MLCKYKEARTLLYVRRNANATYLECFFPPMLNIVPDTEHPIPNNFNEEAADSLQANARVAANTATLLYELGMPFEMTAEDEAAAAKMFAAVDAKKKKGQDPKITNPPELYQGNVALKLGALLSEYDKRVILDATQARTYIMNRLLELSGSGDAKTELRALELMGKMSDIGAFTEKSEVTITHRSSGDLKAVLEEKITRLLSASVVDVEAKSVHEELGLEDDGVDAELDALAEERKQARTPEVKDESE